MLKSSRTIIYISPIVAAAFIWLVISIIATPAIANRGVERTTDTTSTKRLALVIGNSEYKSSPLKNPVNDASDIARALKKHGFQVTLLKNSGQREMKKAIKKFGKKLRSGGVGLFYFAGHGMQHNGRNYLIPADAQIEDEADVEYEAVDAGRVLSKMEVAGNGLNIVILDACRNNPFARSFRSADQGLAKMDAPTGSLIAYATSPGSVAADGEGSNGVYTKYLLKYISQPGLAIERVFKQVRKGVLRETSGKQTPWESSSLTGDFSFAGSSAAAPVIVSPSTSSFNAEDEFWKVIQNSNDISDLQLYLDTYPNGRFVAVASLKLRKLKPKVEKKDSQPGQPYTDKTTGMEFVFVKGGCYQMGDIFNAGANAFGEGGADEKPVHEVCVNDFWMGKYEVTQGQYQKITGSNPSKFKNGNNYPVEKVSWDDAILFIAMINYESIDKKIFRLPTEAEWEYAARSGGKKQKYSGGNSVDSVAWHYRNSGSKPHKVGAKSPNGLGLYDMSGNVYEWCSDWYGENYYSSSPGNNPRGASSGSDRVFRGGGWNYIPRYLRAASRAGRGPGFRGNALGFRLVLSEGSN